jgi:SWI/SNF-related matrix-associated actin-dependent regulator of chromatin subfamily A-like protein 1
MKIAVTTDKKGNDFFSISFPYHPTLVEAVKKIPLRKFDAKSKNWNVRADHQVIEYIEVFAKYFKFEITEEAQRLIDKFKQPISENEEMPTLKMQLRPFQKVGVLTAIKFERCFIADEMGLGKTAESIAAVEKLNAYPCLVVVPASLKLNWQREINMWVNRSSKIISGVIKRDEDDNIIPVDYDADFVIINYDILDRDATKKKNKENIDDNQEEKISHLSSMEEIKFKSIIFDESHYIKNHKAQRTKAIKKLAKGIKYRFALTGTPLLNKPKELMTQLDALDRLDSFGGFWSFAKRYCGAFETEFGWSMGDSTNLDELHDKLDKLCMIRRLKIDVLKELPPKQRTYLPIEIDNEEEYKLAVKDFRKWLRKKLIDPEQYKNEVEHLKNLTKSQKKLLIESKINSRIDKTLSAEALVKIEYLKQLTVRGKMTKFKEFIDNALEQGIKLVVFATHKDIQNELWEIYKDRNATRIFAEDTLVERDKNISKFQTDDSCRLIIASLKAGGVGITLTKSSTVVFIEFGWTPADHDQAEDRCHRMGQNDSVNCYYLYGKDTIDEGTIELIQKKRSIAEAAIDGKSTDISVNDMEEILSRFI